MALYDDKGEDTSLRSGTWWLCKAVRS